MWFCVSLSFLCRLSDAFWQSIYFVVKLLWRPAAAPTRPAEDEVGRGGVKASLLQLTLPNTNNTTQHTHNNRQQKEKTVRSPDGPWALTGPASNSLHCVCWKQRWRIKYHVARWSEGGTQWEREREGGGRGGEGDDWPLLGIMENLEEDPLCCCRAVSDEEWLLSLLILPSYTTTISNLPSL